MLSVHLAIEHAATIAGKLLKLTSDARNVVIGFAPMQVAPRSLDLPTALVGHV